MSEQKRFTLRIDKNIFDKVQSRAEKNKRSVAKEIEYILDEYMEEKRD